MKLFGLTGGIGMGKSTAASHLQRKGLAVADTDVIARHVVEPGQPALNEIAARFGKDMLATDGSLRRDRLAQIVFGDETERHALEAILHPRIRQVWRGQVGQWRSEGRAMAFVVIPLLYETDAAAEFDAIICLACTLPTQAKRLEQRGLDAQQIRQRNEAQWPIARKMAQADYVIWSEGVVEVLVEQLDRIVR